MAALLLAGHGSSRGGVASLPIRTNAQSIRKMGVFDEVHTAFWKEEPRLRGALERIESTEVAVVPFFMAEGWYTRTVVPRELGLGSTLGRKDVYYARPIGAHEGVADLALARIDEAMPPHFESGRTAVLIVGHGTGRSHASGATTEATAEAVRSRRRYATVATAFLDQVPTLTSALESLAGRDIVVVPFFASDGEHVRHDVARLAGARRAVCAQAVGTHAGVASIIVALAREAPWAPST
jgi:sirohydrochlorin cobaltochelatase